jgi:hypothetical protein
VSAVNWSRYNLPAIWGLIADVDVCDGADRVLAWDGLASAVRDQHKRLLAAADSLAAVWPPAQNDSAEEFQRQVRGLADSMQETLSKAEDTKAGLNGVVQAFSTAQGKIRDLASGREGVSNDWMPRFVDHAEDKYDEHAQAAMRDAEAAIGDHSAQIQAPKLYELRATKDDGRTLLPGNPGGGSGGSSGPAALRATPVPVSDHPSADARGGSTGPDTGSGSLGTATGSDAMGPVLSGFTPPPPPLGGTAGLPTAPGLGGPLGTNPVGVPGSIGGPGGGGAVPGGFGVLPFGGGSGAAGGIPGRAGSAGSRRPLSTRRAMPSGAVIGETSESGDGRGVFGAAPMGGAAGAGRAGQRRRAGGVGDGDADLRWETREGVVPVIRPDSTGVRHDPGPGVIGVDR